MSNEKQNKSDKKNANINGYSNRKNVDYKKAI